MHFGVEFLSDKFFFNISCLEFQECIVPSSYTKMAIILGPKSQNVKVLPALQNNCFFIQSCFCCQDLYIHNHFWEFLLIEM